MKVMSADILFKAYKGLPEVRLIRPTAVHIESSWDLLTDKAEITIARNVKDFDKQKVKDTFLVGRPVEIQLGYSGNNTLEFSGYITKVSADIPIKISLEDEMWKLKQIPVNLSVKSMGLKDFIQKIAPGIKTDVADWTMPPQRHKRTTVAKVLEFLKKEYKLYSYFKGDTLVVGKIYDDDKQEPVIIHLEGNTVKNNALNYLSKEDIKIKIRAVSTLKTGQKLEAVVGDENGTEQQLAYYGIEVKAELEKVAERDYEQMKRDGFDGDLKIMGQPRIFHGQKVKVVSNLYPDRNGIYYVDAITVDWNVSDGYARTLKLGKKAS